MTAETKTFTIKKRLLGALVAILVVAVPILAFAINDVGVVDAQAGDAEVTLSWDAVTDADFYRIYYGTESVSSGEAYNLPTIDTPDNTASYTIEGLTNGVTYYFSVTAVDGADEESVNYSDPEVSATPQAAGGGDAEIDFAILDVEVPNNETVEVEFTEAVVIPANAATELDITYNFDATELSITSVSLKPDSSERTIIISTLPQVPGGEYTLEIPESFKDKDGNSLPEPDRIAIFLGSEDLPDGTDDEENNDTEDGEEDIVVEDTGDEDDLDIEAGESDTLIILSAIASADGRSVLVEFSESVTLPVSQNVEPFTILNNSNPSETLDIIKVELDPEDSSKVMITTGPQKPTTYTLVVANVADSSGDLIAGDNSTLEFTGIAGDSTPPEGPTNLQAILTDAANLLVDLTWSPSIDSAGDLLEYVIYVSSDDGQTFRQLRTISKDADAKAILNELAGDTTHTIKVTARDNNGNESEGVLVALTLPKTGPGLAILALGSLLGGRYLVRRRKRD